MKTKVKVETPKPDERAKEQAKAQVESICLLVANLRAAQQADDDGARDAATQAIHEDPLSVEVRGCWHTLDTRDNGPAEYKILLCWGGPAVQIIGELDCYNRPDSATIQYQDWGTYWTDYHETTSEQDAALLAYAQQFYFGE